MIFNILDNNTELYMKKYIIGEIFSSGVVTLYKNHSWSNHSWLQCETTFMCFCELVKISKTHFFLGHPVVYNE